MSKKFGSYLNNVGCTTELVQKLIDYRMGAPKSTSDRLVREELVQEFKDDDVKQVVVQFITAILAGKHVILEGVKGTGKNTLINLVAYLFGRPLYTYSFNKYSDVDSIVGSNILKDGNVEFKPHQLTEALEDEDGAWFIADEINMARGDTLAFLHELLDDRGEIEIPAYGKIQKNRHFRFIGTMNYGYTGTADLNEAFADRFEIIHIDPLTVNEIAELLQASTPKLNNEFAGYLGKIYHDCHRLASEGEISSRGVTIRGLKSAVELIVDYGLQWRLAFNTSILNKTFDDYEKSKINDIINATLPTNVGNNDFTRAMGEGTSGVDISDVRGDL